MNPDPDAQSARQIAKAHWTMEELCRGTFGSFAQDLARKTVQEVKQRCRELPYMPTIEQIVQEDMVRQRLRCKSYREDTTSVWRDKCLLFEAFFSHDFQRKWGVCWAQVRAAHVAQKKYARRLWTKTLRRAKAVRFIARLRARVANRHWCDTVESRMFEPGERGYEVARDEFNACKRRRIG